MPGLRTWLLCFLLLPLPAAAQLSFSDPALGFAMTLPEGFLREGEDPLAPANVIACFVSPSRGQTESWVRLCAERLDGTLPRKPLSNSDLPPAARPVAFTWKGFDLQGVRAETTRDGRPITIIVALVPLRTTGIRLAATAPRAHGMSAQSAVVSTLASLQGETSWLSRSERAEKAGEGFGQIGAILIAIGVGMWIMKRRMSKS